MQAKTGQKKLGILGGGQLARMMIQKAHEHNYKVWVLCPSADDPAAQVTQNWIKGNPSKLSDLKKFFKKMDVITFESEFLDCTLINKVSKRSKTPVYPSAQIMGKIQDRLSQKQLLDNYKIPSADWIQVDNFDEAKQAVKTFKKIVLKKRRFGYDGYGTFIISNSSQLGKIKKIVNDSEDGFIAEKWIPFRREMAILLGRDQKGQIIQFPLVQSLQKDAKCFWVKGPLKHNKLAATVTRFKKLMAGEDYIGLLAIELFETGSQLIVNELAPRVHNTGHYSLNCMVQDQFSSHLMACLGQDLRTPRLNSPAFAMLNLIGRSNKPAVTSCCEKVFLHWYGKTHNRKGRKMGHLNSVGKTPTQALNQLLATHKGFQL